MEVVPYRKTDYTIRRDQRYLWMAGVAGYVGVRVDIRGSGLSRLVLLPSRQNPSRIILPGDSEGFYNDEYEKQEQDDACSVIAWLGKQPWCTGSVGLYGKSWGTASERLAFAVSVRNSPCGPLYRCVQAVSMACKSQSASRQV